MSRLPPAAVGFAIIGLTSVLIAARPAAADEPPRYHFTAGQSLTYEVTVRSKFPAASRLTTGYLIVRPAAGDDAGSIRLNYAYGVRGFDVIMDGDTEQYAVGSLVAMLRDGPTGDADRQVTLDPDGTLRKEPPKMDGAGMDMALGSAWRLVLPPLPPAGQQAWSARRRTTLLLSRRNDDERSYSTEVETHDGHPPFPVEVPAAESVDYAVAPPPQAGQWAATGRLDVTSDEKAAGGTPTDHFHGDGRVVFDVADGHVTTAEWTLTAEQTVRTADRIEGTEKTTTSRFPVEVKARLMTDAEVEKLKTDVAACDGRRPAGQIDALSEMARAAAKAAKPRPPVAVAFGEKPPAGTEATMVLGHTAGTFWSTKVDGNRRPVVGFRIETASNVGRPCFAKFEPLFESPPARHRERADTKILMARDGYAVGAIRVNVDEYLTAVKVVFMKRTAAGVDPKQSYESEWFNTPVNGGTEQTLGGTGRLVLGTCGQGDLDVNAIGLLLAADKPKK